MGAGSTKKTEWVLRAEILPALLTYGVVEVEVAYASTGGVPATLGAQFRDANGYRVSRLSLPATLTARLEQCVAKLCVEVGRPSDDEGTVTVDVRQGDCVWRSAAD